MRFGRFYHYCMNAQENAKKTIDKTTCEHNQKYNQKHIHRLMIMRLTIRYFHLSQYISSSPAPFYT